MIKRPTICVSVPSRNPAGGAASAQWTFAVSLRMRGRTVRCLVPTKRWLDWLDRYMPDKLHDFLIDARSSAQARMFTPCVVLTADWVSLLHRKSKSIPIFHGGYGLTLRFSPPTSIMGVLKTKLLWQMQRWAARRAPTFIAVSHEALESFGFSHGQVLFNAIDLDRITPPTPKERSIAKQKCGFSGETVMLAGRYSVEKRLESVLELPQRRGRRYLVCIPNEAQSREFAELCKHRPDITVQCFPDGIPEQIWKSTDVLYMPSKYEGCSLLWIEAAARGVPVVATCVGHLIELEREHHELADLLLPRDDIGAASEKIDMVLSQQERWCVFMRSLAVQHHDIRKIGADLDSMLERVGC